MGSEHGTARLPKTPHWEQCDHLRIGVWFPVWFVLAQPQRDMCWLHRLLDHREEVLAQLRQVHLAAQRGAESRHRASGIILAPVEAPVDDGLDAMAQGLEERGSLGPVPSTH
jgi:hypothetical protein